MAEKFSARLIKIEPHESWTQEALDSLIGQVPNLFGVPGSPIARVIAAKVEAGWVVVTLEPLP